MWSSGLTHPAPATIQPAAASGDSQTVFEQLQLRSRLRSQPLQLLQNLNLSFLVPLPAKSFRKKPDSHFLKQNRPSLGAVDATGKNHLRADAGDVENDAVS